MAFDLYPFTVGHARCTALKDAESEGDTANAFHHDDPEEFARAAARHGIDPERITLSYTCLLIELGGARVLIDGGAGGALFELLERLEIAPDTIDALVLSHAHMDHYAGHLDAEGAKRFPGARYLMWGDEWRHYTSDEQLARDRKRLGDNFATLEQHFLPLGEHLELLDTTNPEIVPGITAVPAPGHTHHHMAVELVSGREALLYLGDAAIHPLALERPEWGFIADVDAERAAATRKTLADRALARDALVMGYHFPFPGLGKLWHQRDALVWGPRRIEAEYLDVGSEGADADPVAGAAEGDSDTVETDVGTNDADAADDASR